MKFPKRMIKIAGSLLLVALAAGQALAHHSWTSEYDVNKPLTITGVVTKVEWTNPHVHIYLDSTDGSGTVTAWNFEMASVLSLERGGWSRRTINLGDTLTIDGFGGRAVTERAIASAIKTNDGQSLFVDQPRD
jgi:DNA/RNA endonuclease YhcR with UshA esterase domain